MATLLETSLVSVTSDINPLLSVNEPLSVNTSWGILSVYQSGCYPDGKNKGFLAIFDSEPTVTSWGQNIVSQSGNYWVVSSGFSAGDAYNSDTWVSGILPHFESSSDFL